MARLSDVDIGKGDGPASATSTRDTQEEKAVDATLSDPPPLPPHLKDHERRASRVNVEVSQGPLTYAHRFDTNINIISTQTIYADSPVDASLLSPYIHQNYDQYLHQRAILLCMVLLSHRAQTFNAIRPMKIIFDTSLVTHLFEACNTYF